MEDGGDADIRGFFFDVNDDSLLTTLNVAGDDVTNQGYRSVANLGNGNNIRGRGDAPYEAGISFGNPGDDDITCTSFVLSSTDGTDLTLDLPANVRMGVRTTSTGPRDDSQKLTFVAPAAPDAIDDPDLDAVEDTPILFDVVANDTDADGDSLTIIDVTDPDNGTAIIVGNQILYTPDLNFGGDFDGFEYTISDGAGGCDTATATIFVEAVADAPTLSVTTAAGDSVNEIILTIDSALTDTDGSESLKIIIDTDMLPPGATLSRTEINDPAASEQVILTLPDGASADFDLVVRATSTEASNNDMAETTQTIEIEAAFAALGGAIAFEADDASMWNTGGEFVFDPVIPFLGVDEGPDNGPWGNALVGGNWNYNIQVGLEQELTLEGGSVDAVVPYDVSVDVFYNITTDQLELDPAVALAAGGFFQTDGPSLEYSLDLLFILALGATVEIADIEVFNPSINVNETVPLIDYDSETSPPIEIGDEDDALSATLAWPNVDVSSTDDGGGDYSGNAASNNVLELNLDVDQTIADLFLGGGNPFDLGFDTFSEFFGTGVKANLELLDLDLTAGLNFLQDFELDAGAIEADIVFEDGSTFDFDLSSPTLYNNASAFDSNGDGTIDFDLEFEMAGATFSNDTDLNLNVGYNLSLLEGSFKAGILGIVEEGSFGPVFETGDTADVAQFDVFEDEFALNLTGDDLSFGIG